MVRIASPVSSVLYGLLAVSIAFALPQAPSNDTSSDELSVTEEEAADAGIPLQVLRNCVTCEDFFKITDPCSGDGVSEKVAIPCLCANSTQVLFQKCLQCVVDVGPETTGISQKEYTDLINGYSTGCDLKGYPNINVTMDVPPTPGSPAAEKAEKEKETAAKNAGTRSVTSGAGLGVVMAWFGLLGALI
ncbi:hypothetical protein D9611_001966 [Ephemerocybe angulata]|uniref:Uncharacterized protein n=1 Tax=Ephemerocybe angulata TaxID=980116 RepID=A0A8H5CHT7_9AGAR|nr:hypothetical protein D9611_001966 [Tulosesus angulatus]